MDIPQGEGKVIKNLSTFWGKMEYTFVIHILKMNKNIFLKGRNSKSLVPS